MKAFFIEKSKDMLGIILSSDVGTGYSAEAFFFTRTLLKLRNLIYKWTIFYNKEISHFFWQIIKGARVNKYAKKQVFLARLSNSQNWTHSCFTKAF